MMATMSYRIIARQPGTVSTHTAATEAAALGVASVLNAAHIPFVILDANGATMHEIDLLDIIDERDASDA